MADKRNELLRLVSVARSQGQWYFSLIETSTFEFERIERARLDLLQSLQDLQTYAETQGLSGAPQSGVVRAQLEAEVEKIRRNVEAAQRSVHV